MPTIKTTRTGTTTSPKLEPVIPRHFSPLQRGDLQTSQGKTRLASGLSWVDGVGR
jgi:hypothetical protein